MCSMLVGFLAGFYPLLILLGVVLVRPIEALFYGIAAILWSIDPRVPGSIMILGYIFSILLPWGFNRGTRFVYVLGFSLGFLLMVMIVFELIAGDLDSLL